MRTKGSGGGTGMVLTVLFLGVLVGALDIAIVGPALPALKTHFGVDDRALAWVFTIYVLFNLIGAPLMAKLSDRTGRRPIYLLAIALFAAGSAMCAAAPSFGVLLVGRSLQGLAAGGIFPVASAVVGDVFPAERKGFALGMIGAVWGLAFLIGPILGSVLLRIGWQWIFLINLPPAALVLVLGAFALPSTRSPNIQAFDTLGLVLLSLTLGGLTVGASNLHAANLVGSLASPLVWPFLLLAVVGAPIFYMAEKRALDPLVRPSLLHTRQLALANGITAGAGLGEGVLVFIPSLAVGAFHVTPSTAGMMTLPVVLAMAVGSPAAGRLLDKVGPRPVLIGGSALLAAGMLLMGIVGGQYWAFYAGSALVGVGLSCLLGAPVRYIMLNDAPEEDRASAQGAVTVFTGIGQLLSGALVGAVAASAGNGVSGYGAAFVVTGAVGLLLLPLALALHASPPMTKAGVPAPAQRA